MSTRASSEAILLPSPSFNEAYFKTGNYWDYLSRRFSQQALDIEGLGIVGKDDYILDFGCAVGGLIRALKERGFTGLKGTDPSIWTIEHGWRVHGLEKELEYFNVDLLRSRPRLLILLDVLEHVPGFLLDAYLQILDAYKPDHILFRVPVSAREGEDYVLEESRWDKTHVQCHIKAWWINRFREIGFEALFISLPSIYDSPGVLACLFQRTERTEEKTVGQEED